MVDLMKATPNNRNIQPEPNANGTRRILITGVTRGLGRALTDEFIRLGHRIYGCGRSATAIAELRAQYPQNVHQFESVDVADDRQVAAWAKQLRALADPPDLLINNAALINEPAPLWEVPPEEFANLLNVNIKGTYSVIRSFLPDMMARKAGVIVNLSSGWGRSTSPQVAPYCTTKWAIEGLTGALARELPDGMAAIAYSPGMIDTDMLRRCFGSAAANHSTPNDWARTEAPALLGLGPRDNGRSV